MLFPSLMLGGCVNRLEALAFLPLALGTAAAAGRLLSRGTRGGRWAVAGGTAFLAFEYATLDPGVSVWPYLPPDPSMLAIAASPVPGSVLDVDPGAAALIRQLAHGRPQTFGYLSKEPVRQRDARLEDALVGPLLDTTRRMADLPPAASSSALRHRWGVAFVVTPDVPPYRDRAARFGFPLMARSPGLSLVYRVPEERLAPVDTVTFADRGGAAARLGVFGWGFFRPETLDLGAETATGRWTRPQAQLLAPLAPGRYVLTVAAPRPIPPRLTVRWGEGREVIHSIAGPVSLELDVASDDLAPDGTVMFRLEASPYAAGDGRTLGVFVRSLRRAP